MSPLPANISITPGSVSPTAVVNYNLSAPGTIVVSVFNPAAFTGAGSVVNINMRVIGPIGSVSPLNLVNFRYNGGLVCSNVSSGTLTVVGGSVAGRVVYENEAYPAPTTTPTPKPVPNTRLDAVGSASFFTLSNASGNYLLASFGPGPYTVTPSRPDENHLTPNGIFSNDPSLIAQHVVGLITLSPVQLRAADVSGLHTITSFDAALVAQWIVGIPNPINRTGTWVFTPPSTMPDTNLDTMQNYAALLMGDVNGDWVPNPPMQPDSSLPPTENSILAALADTKAAANSTVTLPLRLSNLRGAEVSSFQFDIVYDPAMLKPAEIAADVTGTLSDGAGIASYSPSPGLLKVVVYGTFPISGEGVYVNLRFKTAGRRASTPVEIRRFRVNDGTQKVFASGAVVDIMAISPSGF